MQLQEPVLSSWIAGSNRRTTYVKLQLTPVQALSPGMCPLLYLPVMQQRFVWP